MYNVFRCLRANAVPILLIASMVCVFRTFQRSNSIPGSSVESSIAIVTLCKLNFALKIENNRTEKKINRKLLRRTTFLTSHSITSMFRFEFEKFTETALVLLYVDELCCFVGVLFSHLPFAIVGSLSQRNRSILFRVAIHLLGLVNANVYSNIRIHFV